MSAPENSKLVAGLALAGLAGTASAATPNILFIITDDQDQQMRSLDYMPKLHDLMISKGTHYTNNFCTVALCCPSRVSLWTGKAAHNTNVTSLSLPFGGYPKFVQEGWNDDWLPVWLEDAGYNMYYSGKLMNSHNINNYNSPFANGFAGTRFFLDPYTYEYYDPIIQKNQEAPVHFTGNYSTDLLADQTVEMIDEAVEAGKPFVVAAAPIGPHAWQHTVNGTPTADPPQPAKRHVGLFDGTKIPRTDNFNPDVSSGGAWVKELPQQGTDEVQYNDEWYQARLEALQAVDDLVETLINRLDHHGILDDTYVIFTSDNGFHVSQHRLPPGKSLGYEEDIRVPLVIRGPNVPAGRTTDIVTTLTDLVPTMLTMLDLPLNHALDGAAIPVTAADISSAEGNDAYQEHVNVEFWGNPSHGGPFPYPGIENALNTYKGVRIQGPNYGFYYQIWCTNEHELYDMAADPYQMDNIVNVTDQTILGRPVPQIKNRLDAVLLVLKTCKEAVCIEPWQELQPGADVHTLKDALKEEYDDFYADQAKVAFDRCEKGYIADAEGPMWSSDGSTLELREALVRLEWE